MGQQYTLLETMETAGGHVRCVQFRHIHPDDQPLFLLSVTDCGGKLRMARKSLQSKEALQTQGLRVLSGAAAPAGGVVAEGR
jgi:hypothetical protein